ncbi:MAG: hypothetical protein GX641_02425 [Mollicutes bacterium]|nr:hypothetical protein [Mollicutes bacterium]
MERIKKGEAITLDDNIEYYVIDNVMQGADNYLYLAKSSDPKEIMIAKEIITDNEISIEEVTDEAKEQEIITEVLKRLDLI